MGTVEWKAQGLDDLLLFVQFCDLGFVGNSIVGQKEAVAGSSHWALGMYREEPFW